MPVNCAEARAALHGLAARLEHRSRLAIVERARVLARLSRAPADHVARHRARLHQHARELRASSAAAASPRRPRHTSTTALVLERKARAAAGAERVQRGRDLERLALALAAHEPQRALERGYALVEDAERRAGHLRGRRARARRADAAAPRRHACPSARSRTVRAGDMTYESACTRIEEVIRRLDSGEAGLRETLELCQEGRKLVEFCAGELDAVAQGLEELRLDELVTRLEAGLPPGRASGLNQRSLNRALLARQGLLERCRRSAAARCSSGWPGCRRSTRRRCTSGCGRASATSRATTSRARSRRARSIQATLMRSTIHLVSRADYWPFAIAVRDVRRASWLRVDEGASRPSRRPPRRSAPRSPAAARCGARRSRR